MSKFKHQYKLFAKAHDDPEVQYAKLRRKAHDERLAALQQKVENRQQKYYFVGSRLIGASVLNLAQVGMLDAGVQEAIRSDLGTHALTKLELDSLSFLGFPPSEPNRQDASGADVDSTASDEDFSPPFDDNSVEK